MSFAAAVTKHFLRSLVTGESIFPLEVPFGRPKPGDDFAKLNREIKALAEADSGYRLEWIDKKNFVCSRTEDSS